MGGQRLQGRTVVVVGAGTSGHRPGIEADSGSGSRPGNGEAAALAYAAEGAHVVAVDRDEEQAVRVAHRITAHGGSALGLRADVAVEADVVAMVAATVAAFGAPHVLHHNVGVATMGDVVDLPLERWRRALDVNLTGAFLTCKHVLPHMLAAGRGVVTSISSVAAVRHTGYVYPAYSATKAALDQLTVSIALTHAAAGIRANAVLPGLIDTPLVGDQIEGGDAASAARHAASPTGRMGRPEDVAAVAVFLATDDARYVNGVCLPVDGGLSARCL